ncbi:hypothetical protein GE09DRAFT_1267065 [Coniochaeta sp. 2T2.1]|nr:hypothetical protein GE09DRAFT_1267065 [Coniochaeta sp. 2T2.1]
MSAFPYNGGAPYDVPAPYQVPVPYDAFSNNPEGEELYEDVSAILSILAVQWGCAELASGIPHPDTPILKYFVMLLDYVMAGTAGFRKTLVARDAELQVARATLVAQLAAAGAARTSNRRIVKDPPTFSGDEKDSRKRYDQFLNWMSQVQLCWAEESSDFSSKRSKILHASGLLGGSANQSIRDAFLKNEFANYADFLNEFQLLADRAEWANSVRVFYL